MIEEITVDPPRRGEVRIKILATGVCHTDAYTLSGADPEGLFPCILGHEGCGIVESLGEGTEGSSLVPGDLVIPLYIPECGRCQFCTHPRRTNLCSVIRETQGRGVMPDGTSRFHCRGQPLFHYMGVSTFSEYTVVPIISLARIRPDAPAERVCLLGCGVTTGWGAACRTAAIEPGSTVAVFGLGGVGLSVIQGAVACGASRIIGIDRDERKFALAQRLGATDCVSAKDREPAQVRDQLVQMTGGGVDYSFECVGHPDVMRAALEACHKGWGVSVIIGVAPAGAEIRTRPFQLVTGRTWKGSAFGGVKGRSELPALVDDYMAGRLQIDPYVTHTMDLTSINEAFVAMQVGDRYKGGGGRGEYPLLIMIFVCSIRSVVRMTSAAKELRQ